MADFITFGWQTLYGVCAVMVILVFIGGFYTLFDKSITLPKRIAIWAIMMIFVALSGYLLYVFVPGWLAEIICTYSFCFS